MELIHVLNLNLKKITKIEYFGGQQRSEKGKKVWGWRFGLRNGCLREKMKEKGYCFRKKDKNSE